MKEVYIIKEAIFRMDDHEELVSLPHTWNNLDGQDGGSDYRRGAFEYQIRLPESKGFKQFLEFQAVNQSAKVYDQDTLLAIHEGGYSTFRVDVSDVIKSGRNYVRVIADNSPSHIYPQQADFTFFGGIYRNVYFIDTDCAFFDLMQDGSQAVFIKSKIDGSIEADAYIAGDIENCQSVELMIIDAEGHLLLSEEILPSEHVNFQLKLANPHLWQGLDDPYLYTARFNLIKEDDAIDQIDIYFAFREFYVDIDKGFFLNGKSYPLRGVSRHQDRLDKGYAISEEDHEEDILLIKELGANTIRLAHYQHDEYFYNLCDKYGFIVWAEIPFISRFMPGEEAKNNTLQQMKELIKQNFNHPSICFWGISNEITIGKDSDDLLQNLKELNHFAKELDPSRLTTMAQLSMLPMDSEHNQITDLLSYNHYFGWYGGSVEENGPWLDKFHKLYPNRPLGISEYGAEGIVKWHSYEPERRDYTEEYQAIYHEKMLECIEARPYLWATHVWNMFDFAADARDEGGIKGRNNKGLMTYDRSLRKDSFYLYKAYWSKEKFVHITSRRFRDRERENIDIKVYSNLGTINLYVNDKYYESQNANKVFVFNNVKLKKGINIIAAEAKDKEGLCYYDEIEINKVDEANPEYVLPKSKQVLEVENWFTSLQDDEASNDNKVENSYSVNDTIGELFSNPKTASIVSKLFDELKKQGENLINSSDNMIDMVQDMKLDFILDFLGFKEDSPVIKYLNKELRKISKNK